MAMETLPSLNWAQDTFLALSPPEDSNKQMHDSWAFSGPPDAMSNPALTIPPSLLTHASIERYGQVTPPEELSPAEMPHKSTREGSIPVDQLRNETNWSPLPVNPNTIQNTPPSQPQQEENSEPPAKRRRSTRPSAANQNTASNNAPPQQQADPANPQPPKRKRGRPKSQPQMIEAFTADGFPFQVSSARQSHLEKNRVAAHKCRQRKKEYINGLEGRCREFSTKNKALKENVAMLREEVLGLKNEVLRHAGCGFWAVDEYLARCAGDLLGMGPPGSAAMDQSHSHSPQLSESNNMFDRKGSFESMSAGSSPGNDLAHLDDFLQMEDDTMEDWNQQ